MNLSLFVYFHLLRNPQKCLLKPTAAAYRTTSVLCQKTTYHTRGRKKDGGSKIVHIFSKRDKKRVRWCGRGDWGLPEPDFEFTGTSLIVTFWKSKLTDRYLDSLELNERQRKVIKYIKEHKKITSGKYATLFKITERTARNDLKELVTKKVVKRKGISDKTTHYVLA